MRSLGAIPLGALLLAMSSGCGDDREPLWIDLEAFGRNATEFERHVGSHGRAVSAAASVAPVHAAEETLARDLAPHLAEMTRRLNDMRRLCLRPDGKAPDVAPLEGVVVQLGADLRAHVAVMGAFTELEPGRGAEAAYQAITAERVAALGELQEALARGAGAYSCSLHN